MLILEGSNHDVNMVEFFVVDKFFIVLTVLSISDQVFHFVEPEDDVVLDVSDLEDSQ